MPMPGPSSKPRSTTVAEPPANRFGPDLAVLRRGCVSKGMDPGFCHKIPHAVKQLVIRDGWAQFHASRTSWRRERGRADFRKGHKFERGGEWFAGWFGLSIQGFGARVGKNQQFQGQVVSRYQFDELLSPLEVKKVPSGITNQHLHCQVSETQKWQVVTGSCRFACLARAVVRYVETLKEEIFFMAVENHALPEKLMC